MSYRNMSVSQLLYRFIRSKCSNKTLIFISWPCHLAGICIPAPAAMVKRQTHGHAYMLRDRETDFLHSRHDVYIFTSVVVQIFYKYMFQLQLL